MGIQRQPERKRQITWEIRVETIDPSQFQDLWGGVVSGISLAINAFDMDYGYVADGEHFAARAIIRAQPTGEDVGSDLTVCDIWINGMLEWNVHRIDGLSYTPEVGH